MDILFQRSTFSSPSIDNLKKNHITNCIHILHSTYLPLYTSLSRGVLLALTVVPSRRATREQASRPLRGRIPKDPHQMSWDGRYKEWCAAGDRLLLFSCDFHTEPSGWKCLR